MKIQTIALTIGLAAFAGIASAETGVKVAEIDNVTNVYGRASVAAVKIVGPVVTRTADEVVPGPTPEEGRTAIAIHTQPRDVSEAFGRS